MPLYMCWCVSVQIPEALLNAQKSGNRKTRRELEKGRASKESKNTLSSGLLFCFSVFSQGRFLTFRLSRPRPRPPAAIPVTELLLL